MQNDRDLRGTCFKNIKNAMLAFFTGNIHERMKKVINVTLAYGILCSLRTVLFDIVSLLPIGTPTLCK